MIINVTRPAELSLILDIVHDHFFSLSALLEQGGSIRTIALREQLGFWNPEFSKLVKHLRIHNVVSIDVNDTENVEYYDLNTIDYSIDGAIEIQTGIPLSLVIHVNSLQLVLEA